MYYFKKDMEKDQLAEILLNLSEDSYQFGSPWSKKQFFSDIELNTSEYILLQENEQWIGAVGYQSIFDEAEITTFMIAQAFKNQGFGLELMTYMLENIQSKNITQVFLEVRQSNERAKKFYASSGFKVIGCRKNYYMYPTEDAQIMCLTLKKVNEEDDK